MSNPALSYSDICLVPRYSELRSRSKADLSVEFLGRRFALPVIPANMQTVINEDIARYLSQNDLPYIYHRFSNTYDFVKKANAENWNFISISVGVQDSDNQLLWRIAQDKLRVDWICVDVAHGHHVLVKEMIEYIRGLKFSSSIMEKRDAWSSHPIGYIPKIIAGNVATPEAVEDLANWGADAIKIGIAQGRACRTYNQTAFGLPMFSCVQECANSYLRHDSHLSKCVPLILDGGVRENGDIAKALVAANGVPSLVMCGGLFAACIDAPGENVYGNTKVNHTEFGPIESKGRITHKCYHGSASERQKGERRHVEGTLLEIPCNGMTYAEKIQEIRESLSSSVSYAGGNDITALKGVEWRELK